MSKKPTTETPATPSALPIPIRKKLQRMLELKVGIKALEAEYERLQADVLKSKYAPQTFDAFPELGTLSQKQNKKYTVDVPAVVEVIGAQRALNIASISKTALEEGVSKVELSTLNEKGAIHTINGSVSYTFKAPPKAKE